MSEPADSQMGRRLGGRKSGAVKNKSAAERQITAEQMLRESMERGGMDSSFRPPRRVIGDHQELDELRMEKRKDFEDTIRRSRTNMGVWAQYALWEAAQKEFERARSVFERALDVDYRNQSIWLKYAEMEMKNRFVNHARNVWERAVQLLPRVDQFWFKFAYMEEMLGNIAGARQIYERWMKWAPGHNAWNTYIKFEVRRRNTPRARSIYERMLITHNELETYIKFAKFEVKHGKREYARLVYERAMKELGEESHVKDFFVEFAKFEESCKEFERARVVYKYALDRVPKEEAQHIYEMYSAFEKKHGTRETVEDVILSKRRFQYEEEIQENPANYDVWFDYIRLEEGKGKKKSIREVYERAIAVRPPIQEKRFWKRYVFLWINYAVYEELEAKDPDRSRQIWRACLELIPHKLFTFAKVWLMAAQFEVRQKNIDGARRLLGTAIGKCPKPKLFKGYIDLEFRLAEIDRCRKIYEKYLEFMPENCTAWKKYGELEASLQEYDRARAIFEMAINQPTLDMPEMLWKAYIDFEIKVKARDKVRALYDRLLERTKHVRVWISRAQFETSLNEIKRARKVFEKANEFFKSNEEAGKEERVMLVEAWLDFEMNRGSNKTVQEVRAKLPRRVKSKKLVKSESGADAYWEEYYDYIFPDEDKKQNTFKLLEMARKWKKQQA